MRIWAPKASTLDLLVGGTEWAEGMPMERIPLTRDGEGWDGPDLPHGTAYGFSIDGGPLRPDPASAEQPWGVHGPSRVFHTSTLTWTDHGYQGVDARGAVLYEMHVGTFTPDGTFCSAIDHLDHLVELGVDVIELLPIAPFPGDRGWGYDGVSWTAVHDVYGGPAGLAEFVNACHARGLGVCLDVVYNHLGPDGNYLAEFGPYFTDKHDTPWGSAINVDDDGSEGVREHILASARRWFTDFHIDALRLDAVHAIMDDSPVHILAELANETKALAGELGRPLRLIAESDLNDPAVITPVDEGGWGMDMQWADDVHHALHSYFTGETHGYYADFDDEGALEKVYRGAFYHDGSHSTFRGSDWGRQVPASIDGHAFVVYDQNHDQVGNRAVGDRPHLTEVESLSSLALVILSPFTPMIFQGQEWNSTTPFAFFTDHNEELGPRVSQGRLNEFATHGWEDIYGKDFHVPDPQALETFTGSTLDWTEKDANGPVLESVTHLIQIRKGEPSFSSPDRAATRLESLGERQLVLHRHSSRLVINLSDTAINVPPGELLLAYGDVTSGITVGPGSLAVIR